MGKTKDKDRSHGSKAFRKPKDSSSESDESDEREKKSSKKWKKSKKGSKRSPSSSSESSSESGESFEEIKSSKHETKKKNKKTKEKRHKKRRSSSSSSSSSSISSPSPVRKVTEKKKELERDDWMSFDSFSSLGRERTKNKRETKPPIDKEEVLKRELNPYWKDGGKGLPEDKNTDYHSHYALSYLEGVLRRAQEEAKSRGKRLDEVLAERWGSEQRFRGILSNAREREYKQKPTKRFMAPRDDYVRSRHSDGPSSSGRWRKPSRRTPERDSRDRRDHGKHYQESRSNERWRKHSTQGREERSDEHYNKRSTSTEVKTSPAKETPDQRSYSSSRISPENKIPQVDDFKKITKNDLNALSAALMKAEWSGNQEAIAKAKADLEKAKSALAGGSTKVILVPSSSKDAYGKGSKKLKTHEEGQRVRYFADDDDRSLRDMFVEERRDSGSRKADMFGRISKQKVGIEGSAREMDDVFEETASKTKTVYKEQLENERAMIKEQIKQEKVYDDCHWCIDGRKLERKAVVHVGSKAYLGVPTSQSLTPGHCLIIPTSHVSCGTSTDEDVWSEMQDYRKAIVKMCLEEDEDVIFFESALNVKYPHMMLEAVPVPKEVGDLAPIYFKKAILESETEWAINKKLVDLGGKGLKKSVPKGLPYFAVFFGLQDGFAHVVEDVKMFPSNFAQEIIGGMMDLDHQLWHKRKRQTSEAVERNCRELKKRFVKFAPLKT